MAISQPSALPSAIPTYHNIGFIHIYSHASIRHIILSLIKPFRPSSVNYHNQIICIQQLPW